MASHFDVINLQEHWLFNFEKGNMANILPGWHDNTKCVDDRDLLPNSHRPSHGQGGVATLWQSKLQPYTTETDMGNSRIAVTRLDVPQSPICIINCYLTSGDSATAVTNFLADMDALHEL